MVKGDDDFIRPPKGAPEDDIGRIGATDLDALPAGLLDGRSDLLGFFPAQQAVLAGMRVEPATTKNSKPSAPDSFQVPVERKEEIQQAVPA